MVVSSKYTSDQCHGTISFVIASRLSTPVFSVFQVFLLALPSVILIPPSSSFLVNEAPSLTIPMVQDVNDEEEYYKSMSLVCYFNGFLPRLTDLNAWISSTWIPIMQK
jgi:hypothetical protein